MAVTKVIQVPFTYYPDTSGGTEVYVRALALELSRRGVETLVAAPADVEAAYSWDGLRVRRFPAGRITDLRQLYGAGIAEAANGFDRVLESETPDLIHLHACSPAVSVQLARTVRRRGLPLVLTYHTPTVSCARGTLMRWGRSVCDGALDESLCTRCVLHGLGLQRPWCDIVALMPVALGSALGALGLAGGGWTAFRMHALVRLRHAAFHALMQHVERVVVLCRWAQDLLIMNGVPASKVLLSPHGLGDTPDHPIAQRRNSHRDVVRLVFVGRLHPTKAPDLVIRAIRAMPESPVTLDIYGIVAGDGEEQYRDELQQIAGNDSRIRFMPPVPRISVPSVVAAYDALVVPSRWLETGPLVVLEAFAAGVPVLGARLGGIAELVHDGVDGLLVEPDSVDAWRHVIGRLETDRHLLDCLGVGVLPPRQMTAVAEEMCGVYTSLVPV